MRHHDHDLDPTTLHTSEFWDDRYGSTEALWSGRPNQRLVENVSGLTPGTALEIGCGEGADAIWLAQQGWTVTAVDVSKVAVERAAGHAAEADPVAAERITWRQQDLREWAPEPASYDLVTEHFLHLPSAVRVPAARAAGGGGQARRDAADRRASPGRQRDVAAAALGRPLLHPRGGGEPASRRGVGRLATSPTRPARDPDGDEIDPDRRGRAGGARRADAAAARRRWRHGHADDRNPRVPSPAWTFRGCR